MRPARLPLFLLVTALAFLLAACNGGDGADDGASPSPSPDQASTPGESQATSSDLPDDVAATVNGEEIAASTVDDRVSAILENPEAAEQFESESEEDVRRQLRARVLTSLVVNRLVHQGAEDLGVEADDERIAEARAQLEEIVGGEQELEDHLATTGVTEEQLEEELRVLALLDAVGEELSGAQGDSAEEQQQRQGAATEWLGRQLAEADVQVDRDYGAWDSNARQVVPAPADA